MRSLTVWLLQLLQLVTLALAGASNWTKPNSGSPSFTDTYVVNERIYVQWLSLNDSINDLWLTRYDPTVDTFSLRLEVAQNISIPGAYEWTIAVNASEVAKDTRFVLQFLPTGSAYDPTKKPQLPSPPFNLITVNQQSPPNGTVGAPSATAVATAATITQANSTSTVPSDESSHSDVPGPVPPGNGLSVTKIVVISVVIGFVILAVGSAFGACFAIKAYRRRKPRLDSGASEEKINGPYEVLGTNRQPTELSSKDTSVHELSSKETMVHEMNSPTETIPPYDSARVPVYEMTATRKQPGVHEMPG